MAASFTEHITSFEARLQQVKVEDVSASTYCRRYLEHLLEHRRYFLKIYAQVLELALQHSRKKPGDIRLLDYGCGNGLLGLFAKHSGFGKVYLNDIDPVFTEGSQKLAVQLGINIDGLITGDMEAVCNTLSSNPPDIICGTDVIEHIYNLDSFFHQVQKLNPGMVTVFTTAANNDQLLKKRKIIQLQVRDETLGSDPSDSTLAGEKPHPSFLSMREAMIHTAAPELNKENVEKLALLTRGMNEQDIRDSVRQFMLEGKPPQPPSHPTNTCNPETGSWTERLLTKEEYASLYARAGFQLSIYNGFFDVHKKSIPQAIISQLLNMGIGILGSRLAPYIVLVGNSTVFNEI